MLMSRIRNPKSSVPRADVMLVREGRFYRAFNASAASDTSRGAALLAAKAAATSDGDELTLGPGTFDIGTSVLDLSIAGTGGVHLFGAGQRLTEIKSQSTPISAGCIVHPGNGSEVSDLTINANLTGNNFQAPFGTNSAASQSAFTDVLLRNVRLIGNTDGIYVSHTDICSLVGFNLEGLTKYDVVAVFPPSTGPNHTLDFYSSRFRCIGPNDQGGGQSRGINSRIGTVRLFGCDVYAENGGDGTTDETIGITINGGNVEMYGGSCSVNGDNTNTRAVKVGTTGSFIGVGVSIAAVGTNSVSANGLQLTGGTAELVSCRVVSSGTGTPLDLVRSGGTLTVSGTKYDAAKTSGTITQGLWQGVTPTSGGLTTLSS